MKKTCLLLLVAVMAFFLVACGDSSSTENRDDASSTKEQEETKEEAAAESATETNGSKILVAYFSATGNTKGIAEKLADGLGADLYEITPEQPYSDEDLNYHDTSTRATVEQNDPASRPKISGSVENMDQYEVVLLGYPIWWGDTPRIMNTFMESYDFSGKTLAAFCTSSSSGFGSSDSSLRDATKDATWLEGSRFSSGAAADEVMKWANGLGIK